MRGDLANGIFYPFLLWRQKIFRTFPDTYEKNPRGGASEVPKESRQRLACGGIWLMQFMCQVGVT